MTKKTRTSARRRILRKEGEGRGAICLVATLAQAQAQDLEIVDLALDQAVTSQHLRQLRLLHLRQLRLLHLLPLPLLLWLTVAPIAMMALDRVQIHPADATL